MYRDGWDAAVARVDALERELSMANNARAGDRETIARLEQELARARASATAPPTWQATPPELLPSSATSAMVMGICALLLCSLLGPVAWAMGSAELSRIDQGVANPYKRGQAQAGRVLGIIATVLFLIALFAFLTMLNSSPFDERY